MILEGEEGIASEELIRVQLSNRRAGFKEDQMRRFPKGLADPTVRSQVTQGRHSVSPHRGTQSMPSRNTLPPETAKLDIFVASPLCFAEVVDDGILQALSGMWTEIPHQAGKQETR
jgi:hypothetical protein